jgi:putative ATPase
MHLRNAVTGLMHGMGYGRGYQYAHDYEGGVAPDQTYLPERLAGRRYYLPRQLGREKDLAERHAQAQRDRPAPSPPPAYRSAATNRGREEAPARAPDKPPQGSTPVTPSTRSKSRS